MISRSFFVFGILALVGTVVLFLVLESTTEWPWYWNWIIAASGLAFIFYGIDKASAKAGGWRVPETVLHLMALGGGFVGALLGMLVFRHKSNFQAHPLFIPMIVLGGALWGGVIYWLLTRA